MPGSPLDLLRSDQGAGRFGAPLSGRPNFGDFDMPRRYEKIRDSLKQSGKTTDEAQRIAAATYNKTRKPNEPKLTSHKGKRKT